MPQASSSSSTCGEDDALEAALLVRVLCQGRAPAELRPVRDLGQPGREACGQLVVLQATPSLGTLSVPGGRRARQLAPSQQRQRAALPKLSAAALDCGRLPAAGRAAAAHQDSRCQPATAPGQAGRPQNVGTGTPPARPRPSADAAPSSARRIRVRLGHCGSVQLVQRAAATADLGQPGSAADLAAVPALGSWRGLPPLCCRSRAGKKFCLVARACCV